MDENICYILYGVIHEIKAKKVLEIGCGYANMLMRLAKECPDTKFFGIDKEQLQINIARQIREQEKLSTVFLECIPYENYNGFVKLFDVVYIHSTIQYLEDVDHFVGWTKRALKPDGVVLVTHVPLKRPKKADKKQKIHNITSEWIIKKFNDRGFDLMDMMDLKDRINLLFIDRVRFSKNRFILEHAEVDL